MISLRTGDSAQKANEQSTMRLAYLTTQYPAVSHTFIRRELLEIESRGHSVLRLAVRPPKSTPVDPRDKAEVSKTVVCLTHPFKVVARLAKTAICHPLRLAKTLALAVKLGMRSERGIIRHWAYVAEACFFLPILKADKTQHVHVHFGTNATAVARFIRRLGGPTFSFTIHGPDEFDAPVGLDLRGKVAECAFVVAISDFCSGQIRRWCRVDDWNKIHVVRCAVGDEFFMEYHPIEEGEKTLICIGRLSEQKGQALLIDAMAELKRGNVDAKLVLVGDGDLRPMLEKRITETGLKDRVTITGYIGGDEIRELLRKSRGLVLSSFAEGLPVVIMEALAEARPVLATYVAGIPELVRTGDNGWLVPAGCVRHLAAAMRIMLETPVDRLNEMGCAGRDAVRRRHNSKIEADRLEALFRLAVREELE